MTELLRFTDYTNDLVVVSKGGGNIDIGIKFVEEVTLGKHDVSIMVFEKGHKKNFEQILELLNQLEDENFPVFSTDEKKFSFKDSVGDTIEVTADKHTVGVKFHESGLPLTMMVFTREHIPYFKKIVEQLDDLGGIKL